MKEYSLTLLLLHGSIYYLLLHYASVIIANCPGEKNIFKKKFPPRFQDYCRLSVNKKPIKLGILSTGIVLLRVVSS